MSQTQYKALISNLLKEKCALTKLRAELEERKERMYFKCKNLGHLARNCRNQKRGEGKAIPQNKFEVLSSRVMQYGAEERMIRSIEAAVMRCFKCREEKHNCRECPLWEKKEKRVAHPIEGKAHQEKRKPACLERGKVQENRERRQLRKVEEKKPAHHIQGEVQQTYKRASVEELRKRVEEHYGKGIPKEAQLFDLR